MGFGAERPHGIDFFRKMSKHHKYKIQKIQKIVRKLSETGLERSSLALDKSGRDKIAF